MTRYRDILTALGQDGLGFVLLLMAASCVGFVGNQFRDHPLALVYIPKAGQVADAVKRIDESSEHWQGPTGKKEAMPRSSAARPISFKDFRLAVEKRHALVLDARPEIFHRLGHVPGAISFPREDFEAAYRRLNTRLEEDKLQLILVYCSGSDCEDSQLVADALTKLGYSNVFVFKGGWNQWQDAHLPLEKAE